MAGDNDPIGVLQQIALNHQLTPNVHSPSNTYQKEKNNILNHPFYRNMAQMNNARPNNEKSPPTKQSNFQSKKKDSIEAEKIYTNQRYQKQSKEHSFQSLSSVSVNNEISAATDMQIEDFFDPRGKVVNSKYANDNAVHQTKLKQSSSQAYLTSKNSNADSYSYKRDSYKAKQFMTKNDEFDDREVTNGMPEQVNLKHQICKKTKTKSSKTKREASANNHGYQNHNKYVQSKAIAEIKSKMKVNTRYSRDNDKQFQNNSRAKSLLNKQNSKSMNNPSSSSTSKVIDLKEMRNKEKQKKQARIGLYGGQLNGVFSNANFSNLNKNYSANSSNLKPKSQFETSNNTIAQIYKSGGDDQNLSYRSYSHISNEKF